MSAPELVMVHPPPPARPRPPEHVRSTLLCSGLAVLREHGRYDEYMNKLVPSAREPIANMIAGVWMPMDVGMAHFEAMDALGMSADEAFAIGSGSGKRIHSTLLHTLIRLASGAGATPWIVFESYGKMWSRIFDGGGIVISKVGPKDALVEFTAFPAARFAYFRNAFRGANHVGLTLFVSTVYVRELAARRSSSEMALRISWV